MSAGLLDYKWIFTICIFLFADLRVAAGPVGTRVLSCATSVHPDGSASYRLSQAPPSIHRCDTTWEDGNRIVMANGLEFDPSRVARLTNRSITLNVCVEHVIHGVECLSMGVSYKTECRANCLAKKNKVTAGPVGGVWCATSVHPDGSASYQLSQPPPPYHSCEATWEDDEKNVIAAGSDRDQSRVSQLTNRSITLHVCLGHVTHGVECFVEGILYKTECRANCSARPSKGPPLTCLGAWCTDLWRVVLAIVLPLGAVVLVFWLVYRLWVYYTSKRRFTAVGDPNERVEYKVSYSAVVATMTSVEAAGEDTKPGSPEDTETGF